jgi:hypothetical protein
LPAPTMATFGCLGDYWIMWSVRIELGVATLGVLRSWRLQKAGVEMGVWG